VVASEQSLLVGTLKPVVDKEQDSDVLVLKPVVDSDPQSDVVVLKHVVDKDGLQFSDVCSAQDDFDSSHPFSPVEVTAALKSEQSLLDE
jgi:hypothetical protein